MSVEALFTSKRCVRFHFEGDVRADSTIVGCTESPTIADLRELMEWVRGQRIHIVTQEEGEE